VQPGLPKRFGTTKFPTEVCGYTARQLRAFYGATPAHNGQGQKIALVELGLNSLMFDTLKDYAKASHIAAPSSQRYSELSLGQGSKCGDPFDGEEQLDVEAAYDMVPAASELVVGGDSCNEGDFGLQGLFDADTAIVDGVGNHPLATVASNSWESADESQPASLTNIEHAYLVRAAAEGVGMYFSTGDVGFLEAPSTDPDAIAVGGTTLGIGKANNRVFETGWSTGQFLLNKKHQWVTQVLAGAAGGGASLLWAQPHYQAGVVPPALSAAPGDRGGQVRSAPDISALADPDTGFLMGLLEPGPGSHPPIFFLSDIGGTSLAAPLVAGLVTAAQQGQPAPFGLINPALYQLAGTSAIHDVLPLTSSSPVAWRAIACGPDTCGAQALDQFDDQSTSMPGYAGLVTLPGYDNMTGIGTPNGQQFITALRALAG
jgi:subtilase family serine protease